MRHTGSPYRQTPIQRHCVFTAVYGAISGLVYIVHMLYIMYSFIQSLSSLSYDRSKASSKASSPHNAI